MSGIKHPTPEPQPGSGSNRPDEPYPTAAADPGTQPQNQPAHVDSFIPVQHVDDSNMPPENPDDDRRNVRRAVPLEAAPADAPANDAPDAPPVKEKAEEEYEYDDSEEDEDEDEADSTPDKPKAKKKKKR